MNQILLSEHTLLLEQITDEIERVGMLLKRHSKRVQSQVIPNAHITGTEGEFARQLLRQRQQRNQLLGSDLFGEPAWDMLLDLFASDEVRRQVSVSSLCIASAVPMTTALRWINILVEAGMILKKPDENDGRRIWLELTPEAKTSIRKLLAMWMKN